MWSMASMATREPIFTPRVSLPWQTKRAPPCSSTSAMCSGDRNPSGAACSVVNDTISPTPGSAAGVIATGWRGQYASGGATTSAHRGHREASIVSIMPVVSPACFEDGDPVVGGEPPDGMGERDAAVELAPLGAARELPHALDD